MTRGLFFLFVHLDIVVGLRHIQSNFLDIPRINYANNLINNYTSKHWVISNRFFNPRALIPTKSFELINFKINKNRFSTIDSAGFRSCQNELTPSYAYESNGHVYRFFFLSGSRFHLDLSPWTWYNLS